MNANSCLKSSLSSTDVTKILSIGKVNVDLNNTENKLLRREFRVAKTLAIVTIVFIICLLPFYIAMLINGSNRLLEPQYSITSWLFLSNSCVNPIIYTLFNHNFRKAFKTILRLT